MIKKIENIKPQVCSNVQQSPFKKTIEMKGYGVGSAHRLQAPLALCF